MKYSFSKRKKIIPESSKYIQIPSLYKHVRAQRLERKRHLDANFAYNLK